MDYGNNLLLQGQKPQNLSDWTASKVSLKENEFVFEEDGMLLQLIPKGRIQYNPKVYKVDITAHVPQETTMFKQYMQATVTMLREDGTSTNCVAVMSPPSTTIGEVQTFTSYIDVNPSPAIVAITFKVICTKAITVSYISLRPSLDIDSSILDAIQDKLPNMMYYTNNVPYTIRSSVVNVAFLKVALGASSNLMLDIFMQGTVSLIDSSQVASLQMKVLVDNQPAVFSPIVIPIQSNRFLFAAPLPLMQLHAGAVSVSLEVSATNATCSIKMNDIQIILSGKNIEGGAGAEPPHAEISDNIKLNAFHQAMNGITLGGIEAEVNKPIVVTLRDTLNMSAITKAFNATPIEEDVKAELTEE